MTWERMKAGDPGQVGDTYRTLLWMSPVVNFTWVRGLIQSAVMDWKRSPDRAADVVSLEQFTPENSPGRPTHLSSKSWLIRVTWKARAVGQTDYGPQPQQAGVVSPQLVVLAIIGVVVVVAGLVVLERSTEHMVAGTVKQIGATVDTSLSKFHTDWINPQTIGILVVGFVVVMFALRRLGR